MKKENIIRTLDRLKKNPGEGLVSKFSWEDQVDEEGNGFFRIRTPEGVGMIDFRRGKPITAIKVDGGQINIPVTKDGIDYFLNLCGGIWGE